MDQFSSSFFGTKPKIGSFSRLNGLGYVLAQVVDGLFKLIKCGSRFLYPAESRYSTTELELLGSVWGIQKCHVYLTGMENFTVITDHRPLLSILNNQTLEPVTSPNIQRLHLLHFLSYFISSAEEIYLFINPFN